MNTFQIRNNTKKSEILSLVLSACVILVLEITVSFAAFTDNTQASLGATGSVGGSYDIAFLDNSNNVQQGNPTAFGIDTTGVTKISAGPVTGSATINTKVVTTTTATGPVTLHLYNAYSGTRPTDPGYTGAGVDPYNVALYSIWVDGTQVATTVTAATFNTAGYNISAWATGVPKTVKVQITLPKNLSNPYYFNRSLVLGLQFDGST